MPPNAFAGGKYGINSYFTNLYNKKVDKFIPSNKIINNIENDKWHASKATESDIEAIDAIKNQLLATYDEAWEYIQTNIQEQIVLKLISTSIYSLAVLNEIEKLMDEYKAQNNIIHISEFNKMIAKVVLKEQVHLKQL